MLPQIINSSGLVLNMLGAAILFRWGLPQPSFQEGDHLILEGPQSDLTAENAWEEKERFTRISKLGLALLFIGFALQFLAIWL